MISPFRTERAREQVERVLSFAAFPGLAMLLDGDGIVVACVGAAGSMSAAELARAFGADAEAIVRDAPGMLSSAHRVVREQVGPYSLVVVVPASVCGETARIEKAKAILERMLVRPPDGGRGPASAQLGRR